MCGAGVNSGAQSPQAREDGRGGSRRAELDLGRSDGASDLPWVAALLRHENSAAARSIDSEVSLIVAQAIARKEAGPAATATS